MHYDKYKYLTPQKPPETDNLRRSPKKEQNAGRPQSPRHLYPPYPSKTETYFINSVPSNSDSPQRSPLKASELFIRDPKLRRLIFETLSSADQVSKELLRYGQTECEYVCSNYFLNRQKLYSLLSNDKNQVADRKSPASNKKIEKRQRKERQSGSSEATEEVPLNHLERLQKIVYNQIIPILQTQLAYEKRRVDKHKKNREWACTDLNEGLILLQRLNQKKAKTDVDAYAQLLEKFIRRVIDKEETLMGKLYRLQEKLDAQMKKNQLLTGQSRKREAEPEKQLLGSDREIKNVEYYKNFVKQIKQLFKEGSRDSTPKTLKVELDLLFAQIKRGVVHDDKGRHEKGCIHKQQKSLHSQCRQDQARSQQQIKSLKDVVKSLDKQIESLREQCEAMEEKLKHSSDKLAKLQTKSKKLVAENEQLNTKVEQLNTDNVYKSNLVGEYLGIVNKLQEHIRSKDDNIALLQQENQRCMDTLAKKNEQYEQMLHHVEQIEENNRELEELEDKAHRDLEEVVQKGYVRQFEVTHLNNSLERYSKEMEELRTILKAKDKLISSLEVKNKEMEEVIGNSKSNEIAGKPIQQNRQVQTEDQLVQKELSNIFGSLEGANQQNQEGHRQIIHQQLPELMNQFEGQQNIVIPHEIINPRVPQIMYHLEQNGHQLQGDTHHMIHKQMPNIIGQLDQSTQPIASESNQAMNQHLPHILGEFGSDVPVPNIFQQPQQGLPLNMDDFRQNIPINFYGPQNMDNYIEFPQPMDNYFMQNRGGIFDNMHQKIGEGYADLFKRWSSRRSEANTENNLQTPKEGDNKQECDPEILQQTIQLMQNGLKAAQQEIKRLRNQNQRLLAQNEELFKRQRTDLFPLSPQHLIGYPASGFTFAQQKFKDIENNMKPDYLPNYINPQVIHEVMSDLNREKELIDERSHSLQEEINLLKKKSDALIQGSKQQEKKDEENKFQDSDRPKKRRDDWMPAKRFKTDDRETEKKRREDWDPGHPMRDEQENNREQKKKREDWDPGHRFRDQQTIEAIEGQNVEIKKKREDWDPGHRVPNEQQAQEQNVPEKKRREDWDPGHPIPNQQQTQEEKFPEKKRREDWDQGHRAPLQDSREEGENKQKQSSLIDEIPQDQDIGQQGNVQHQKIIAQEQEENKRESEQYAPQSSSQRRSLVDQEKHALNQQQKGGEENELNERQAINTQEDSKSIESVQIPNLVQEFIQVKQPTVEQLLDGDSFHEKKKSFIMGIDSQKSSDPPAKREALIKIQDKDPEQKCPSVQVEKKISNPEEKDEVKGSQEVQLPPEVYQNYKLKQLQQIVQRMKKHMIEMIAKKNDMIIEDQINICLKELENVQNLLSICRKNTTKKLHRLKRIETMRRQAEEEIISLQKKLETANQMFSNITSQEEVSALSFNDQLQQILRHKPINENFFMKKWDEEFQDAQPPEMFNIGVQTEGIPGVFLESSVRRYLPDLRRLISNESLVNSFMNKSFIDQLESLALDWQERTADDHKQKIKSELFGVEAEQRSAPLSPTSPKTTEEVSKKTSKQQKQVEGEVAKQKEGRQKQVKQSQFTGRSEDLKRSRIKIDDSVKDINSLIEFHREQIINLHRMIKRTDSRPYQQVEDSLPHSPDRRPLLENEQFVEQINKAPKKYHQGDQDQSDDKILEDIKNDEIKQLKKMFKNREHQLQLILFERDVEIERLKAIMKKISLSKMKDQRGSPLQSRTKEFINHEMEELKSRLAELQLAFQKQKNENEKMRWEIRQNEVQQSLLKMRLKENYELQLNSFRESSPQDLDGLKLKLESYKEIDGKVIDTMELNSGQIKSNDKNKSNQKQAQQEEQNNKQGLTPNNVNEEKQKNNQQDEGEEEKKQKVSTKSIKRRFSRRSEPAGEAQKKIGGTNSELKVDFGWQDLVPQYFGKHEGKR